jgi:hypothetical protein
MLVLVEKTTIARTYVEIDWANQAPIIAKKNDAHLDWKHVKTEYDVDTRGLTKSQIWGPDIQDCECILANGVRYGNYPPRTDYPVKGVANGVRYGDLSKIPGQDVVVNWVYNGDLEKTVTEDEVLEKLLHVKDYGTPDGVKELPKSLQEIIL